MFFSNDDVDRIARYAWEWDVDHGLALASWEMAKGRYRERAEFIVSRMNKLEASA